MYWLHNQGLCSSSSSWYYILHDGTKPQQNCTEFAYSILIKLAWIIILLQLYNATLRKIDSFTATKPSEKHLSKFPGHRQYRSGIQFIYIQMAIQSVTYKSQLKSHFATCVLVATIISSYFVDLCIARLTRRRVTVLALTNFWTDLNWTAVVDATISWLLHNGRAIHSAICCQKINTCTQYIISISMSWTWTQTVQYHKWPPFMSMTWYGGRMSMPCNRISFKCRS